jgi:hypothetical protein
VPIPPKGNTAKPETRQFHKTQEAERCGPPRGLDYLGKLEVINLPTSFNSAHSQRVDHSDVLIGGDLEVEADSMRASTPPSGFKIQTYIQISIVGFTYFLLGNRSRNVQKSVREIVPKRGNLSITCMSTVVMVVRGFMLGLILMGLIGGTGGLDDVEETVLVGVVEESGVESGF